jgi:type II secretory pathway pseudopilin PulG
MRDKPRHPGAFTLTEMIVVMTVVLIMLAVSIPTFRSTMASAESSNAETHLRLAILAGRNAALHSDRGADTAVVFLHEPGGRCTAVVCEYAGTIRDYSGSPAGVERDVFAPISGAEPVQLPVGYMVRGFVPAGMMDISSGTQAWYEGDRYDTGERNWVFPENAYYDALSQDDGADRQSFIVRFSGGVGAILVGDTREVLVVDPRPTASGRSAAPWSTFRVDIGDVGATVREAIVRLNNQGGLSGGGGANDTLTRLFGDQSGDTVLGRAVEQVVLYREADLAAAIGQKLDPDTGTLYQNKPEPKLIVKLNSSNAKRDLRRWLEGDTNRDGVWLDDNDTNPDAPVARIYTFQRYSGALQPVPLLNLENISGNRPGGGS